MLPMVRPAESPVDSPADTPMDSPEVEALDDATEEAGCGEPCVAARRRDKEATKRSLLAAAVEVFAKEGFDGATTREVAARAGVNEGLIQRYFGGKAGLLQAIVAGMWGEKLTTCRLAPPTECLKTEIAGFLKHEIGQAATNRDFMRVLLSRALVDPDLAAMLKRHYKESRIPLLVQRLAHFKEDGRLDPATDLQTLAATIITFAFGLGFMQQVVLAEDPEHLDTMVASIAETVVRGTAAPV